MPLSGGAETQCRSDIVGATLGRPRAGHKARPYVEMNSLGLKPRPFSASQKW